MNIKGTLAKRKKLVADRSGLSRLKQAITADDLVESDSPDTVNGAPSKESLGLDVGDEEWEDGGQDDVDVSEEDGDDDDIEDDFLARELEEEWG